MVTLLKKRKRDTIAENLDRYLEKNPITDKKYPIAENLDKYVQKKESDY